jgi:surface carbohydrate biosynthesis protein (TIGR04326 family)
VGTDASQRILVIVDDTAAGEAVPAIEPACAVDVLALTGDWTRVESWRGRLAAGGCAVTLLPAGLMLAEETDALQSALPDWSERLGTQIVDGRTVREWLATADGLTSVFWYGSIAERNAFKCPELLRVAQARVIDRCVRGTEYRTAVVRCGDVALRDTAAGVCAARGIPVDGGPDGARAGAWSEGGTAKEGLVALAKFAVRGLLARGLSVRRTTDARDSNPLLCLTYYPFLDRAAAAEGRFINRYFSPVQRMLQSEGRPVWWVGIFVFIDGWGFRDAVALTRRLSRAGQRVALLDAYFTPAAAFRVLRQWLRLRRAALRLMPALDGVLTEPLLPRGAEALARRLWLRSYAGIDLVRGLYYHEVFRRLMRDSTSARTCVYPAEFQPWEQALNIHAGARMPALDTIGFQHTSVSRNYAFYFHDARERSGPLPFPLPSTLAFSGRLPERLLEDCAYPSTAQVEAIRQLHLVPVLEARERASGNPPRLLVACTIDRQESRAMLALVFSAIPAAAGVRVVLRGHPSQPLGPICEELGVSPERAGYTMSHGSTDEALREADLVLVGSSSLAIEALAYGCEVLTPCFGSFLPMTPLAGFDDMYKRVYGPADLLAALDRYRRSGPARPAADKRAFVREYWNLDESLAGWRALMREGRTSCRT